MIKTRRHQKGSLVAVAHNGLWWPGSSPLTEQSRVSSSHLLPLRLDHPCLLSTSTASAHLPSFFDNSKCLQELPDAHREKSHP